jgi:hypothetical protein
VVVDGDGDGDGDGSRRPRPRVHGRGDTPSMLSGRRPPVLGKLLRRLAHGQVVAVAVHDHVHDHVHGSTTITTTSALDLSLRGQTEGGPSVRLGEL